MSRVNADPPVSLPWDGEAPDMGAYEQGAAAGAIARAAPAYPRPREDVRFDVSTTGGPVQSVEWHFGDGASAQGPATTHAYEREGQYCARARVRYRDGTEQVDMAFVKVAEPVDPRAPLLTVDFEDETLLEWGYLFKFYRQRNTGFERVGGGYRGGKCMRLFAEPNGSILGCALAPGEWDIDAYPLIRFAYRIPKGVPVGLYVQAFPAEQWGEGAVILGGTAARAAGPYVDLGVCELADDGEWHEATVDVRAIRQAVDGVKYLRRFRFYTHNNGAKGQEFWFDEFAVLPKQ